MEQVSAEWGWAPHVKVDFLRKFSSCKIRFYFAYKCFQNCWMVVQKVIGKLNDLVANITEQTAVNALKICNVDYNKVFIESGQRSALNEVLAFVLDDPSRIRNSFENAIVQVASAPGSLAILELAVSSDTVAIKPISRYAAKILKPEVKQSVKDLDLTSFSPCHWTLICLLHVKKAAKTGGLRKLEAVKRCLWFH